MSACVLDASALVAAAIDTGVDGRWSEDLVLSRDLVAPEIVLAEATNILRRLERAGRLDTTAASLALRDVMALDLELCSFAPFAPRVWELRRNVTAYDAWYVAVAEALELPLATLDLRLVRSSGPRCEFLHRRALG